MNWSKIIWRRPEKWKQISAFQGYDQAAMATTRTKLQPWLCSNVFEKLFSVWSCYQLCPRPPSPPPPPHTIIIIIIVTRHTCRGIITTRRILTIARLWPTALNSSGRRLWLTMKIMIIIILLVTLTTPFPLMPPTLLSWSCKFQLCKWWKYIISELYVTFVGGEGLLGLSKRVWDLDLYT